MRWSAITNFNDFCRFRVFKHIPRENKHRRCWNVDRVHVKWFYGPSIRLHKRLLTSFRAPRTRSRPTLFTPLATLVADYRVTACNATHGIAIAILFVCLSVRPSDAYIVTKLNDAL